MCSCPVDETTSVLPSTKVGISRFTTEGFKFIADHPFVFVHCHIRICDAGNPNSRCDQGCIEETRKRRDVSSDDKLYSLAQGPLTIDDDAKEMNTKSTLRSKYLLITCEYRITRISVKFVLGFLTFQGGFLFSGIFDFD